MLWLLFPFFSAAQPCSPLAVERGDKIRLHSLDGEVYGLDVLKCDPEFLYAQRKGKWALLTLDGQFRTPFRFDDLKPFDLGLAAVRIGDQQGYINAWGEAVIPIVFEIIRVLEPGRFLARDGRGWSLLNAKGESLDGPPYDKVSAFMEGFAVTKRDSLFGLITEKGQVLASPRYDQITKFFEGLAMVSRDGRWGHIDQSGREVIPPIYDEVFVFYQGLSIARKGPFWGYIDRQNNEVLPFVFDHVEYFESGRAQVSRNGRWGYIDMAGREVIPLIYDRIHPFHDGMAKVEINGHQGYLNVKGEMVIEPVYDEIYRFMDGVAMVRKNGRFGFVRSDGSVLSEPVWDGLLTFRDGIARVQLGDKFGLINRENEQILAPLYDEIGTYEGGMVSVRQGSDWMFLDAMPSSGPLAVDPERAARIRVGESWGYIDQSGRSYGFSKGPAEFVDTYANLGKIEIDQHARYTFHFRNNSDQPLRLKPLESPCGCTLYATPGDVLAPGQFGQIHLDCETDGIHPDWQIRLPVQFEGQEEPILLHMRATRPIPDSTQILLEEVPINGRYVFLMDISASMDELPLAKMIFSKLAGSLCKNDNVSIVSFNSFSKVELRPTENHSEVVHTIRQLRPSLKTDAGRGLRLSYAILEEPGRALEKHIYMASDGDIDTAQLARVLHAGVGRDVLLTVFVFSYTGDRTEYERLIRLTELAGVRFVYADRENITEVLEQEYTDIGCLPPELMPTDSLPYQVIASAPDQELRTIRERRRYGALDQWDNLVLPPLYEFLDYPGEGLIRTRLGNRWALYDRCSPLTSTAYDSIGTFNHAKAYALRNGQPVLLDHLGREHQYMPDWASNTLYQNIDTLAGQPVANLTLLLDVSSSMESPEKLPLLKETFSHFTGLLRYEDQVAIVTYTSTAALPLPSVSASQRRLIVETIQNITSKGNTVLLEGLEMAYSQSVAAYVKEGNNRVILATDGRFDVTEDLLRLLDRYKARGIHLSLYLFGETEKKIYADNLRKLATRAAGSYHYATADNIRDLMLHEALLVKQAGQAAPVSD